MAEFFDKFPTIYYNTRGTGSSPRSLQTNLLTRLTMEASLKNNGTTYYNWQVDEGDTIEILAEKLYGNPEYHFILAWINDYTDPLFDWPYDYANFTNFINNKYGSRANSVAQIHHYELSIARKDLNTQTTLTIVHEIDANTYNTTSASAYIPYTLSNGSTVEETTTTEAVTAYDWEVSVNETKRQIKVLRNEYLGQALAEFDSLQPKPSYYRGLKKF